MGIFDKPKKILDSSVWENNKLRPDVRLYILKRLESLTTIKPVKFIQITFIGSTAGYQYSESSDIDIQVILHPQYDDLQQFYHQVFKTTNGQFLPGTVHPINFFILTSPAAESLNKDRLTVGYDLITDEWIKKPKRPTHEELYQFELNDPVFKLQAEDIARQLAQYKRRPNAQELEDIAGIYQRIDTDRKTMFQHPSGHGGSKSYANAMYKYLENLYGSKLEKLFHKYYDPVRNAKEQMNAE